MCSSGSAWHAAAATSNSCLMHMMRQHDKWGSMVQRSTKPLQRCALLTSLIGACHRFALICAARPVHVRTWSSAPGHQHAAGTCRRHAWPWAHVVSSEGQQAGDRRVAATSTLAAAVTTDLRQYQASGRGCIQRASTVHAGRGDTVAVCSGCWHQQVRQLQQGYQHERPAAHMNRNGDNHD